MKFSYSQKLNKYVVTELGNLIDSDEDGIALGIRHGFVSIHTEDEEQEEFLLEADDDTLPGDDDLAVIREFLEEV